MKPRLHAILAAALLTVAVIVGCQRHDSPEATPQSDAAPAPAETATPAESTEPLPSLGDAELEELLESMVAGNSYHLDLRFRGKLHLWRVRFDGQEVIGSDGQPTVIFGSEGPAVFGEAGTGPLTIYPIVESGWRWKQDGANVELWKGNDHYRGMLSGNTITGNYEEGAERGTFVMTRAE